MSSRSSKIKKKFDSFDRLAILILCLFSFFAFYQLGHRIFNNDAHFWYERTYNFISAIKNVNFIETFQDPKPGVTVMWLSGVSIETFLTIYKLFFGFRPLLLTYETFPYIHFAARAPLVILSILTVFGTYVFASYLTDKKTGVLAASLLAFSNFFLAGTRIFHADSTLTFFMTIGAFLIIYSIVERKQKLYFVSAVFAGLAILTKLSGIFLVPYFFLISVIWQQYNKKEKITYLRTIKPMIKWIIVVFATIFILFPAFWVAPFTTSYQLLKEIFSLTTNGRDGVNPFWFYFTTMPQYFGTLHLSLGIFGLSTEVGIIFKQLFLDNKKISKKSMINLSLILYLVFYLLQMSLVSQKMPRYLLPLFPIFMILASNSVSYLSAFLQKIFDQIKNAHVYIYAVIVISALAGVINYFPHYSLAFTTQGRDSFDCTLCYEAAESVNEREENPEFTVLVDSRNPQRLIPFIKGTVVKQDEVCSNCELDRDIKYIVMEESDILRPQFEKFCTKISSVSFKSLIYWKVYSCFNENL